MRRPAPSPFSTPLLLTGIFLVAWVALGAIAADLFRFSRPITASPGWARLVLPDDVLDACRTNLPDVRIVREGNVEVPWALEERVGAMSAKLELRDVERSSRSGSGNARETTALVDRGPHPSPASAATLEIDGEDYLKPVRIEASDDRTSWRVFAEGSVFSTRLARSTTIRFAPNDRRWWRLRFDDRNGDPINPRALRTDNGSPVALREVALALRPTSAGDTTVTATAPAANLGIVALRIRGAGAAYARRVHVVERVFFRGEVLRRPIGDGTIVRSPDGSGNDEIPVGDGSARSLEIEIESADGPLLELASVTALAKTRAILFSAPEGSTLRLLYGSSLADPPQYDLERALAAGRPRDAKAASLGAAQAISAAAFPLPERGSPVDAAGWKRRHPIVLPSTGNIAYLDLSGTAAEGPGTPRIVDEARRQVPYVLERAAHRERRVAAIRNTSSGTKTIVEISGLGDPAAVDTVELTASAPAYFSREAVVLEEYSDPRGAAGTRVLGTASWEKRPEDASASIAIPIQRPSGSRVRIQVENGDNAPLVIASAAVDTSVPRIDFVFVPGEALTLLSGNAESAPPRYDLELVAARVLSAPALPARLATPHPVAKPGSATPSWLWAVVAAAAVLVGLVLARTLRAPAA